MFHGWTPLFFWAVLSGVLFRLPACGCRFGSGPGRFWCLCLSPPGSALGSVPFGGVQLLKEEKGTDPKNRQ